MHHAYRPGGAAARAIEAGSARAVPSEESDSNRDVPPGWVRRVMLYVAFDTNASIARKLVIASAAVSMPVVPGAKFGYVMPAGACETLTLTACARVSMRPRKSACGVRVRITCAGGGGNVRVQRSAPVALAGALPSWMLGVSDG
jgi:hypothetical protein